MHPASKFSCFVLQKMHSGLWEDVTSEDSLEAILKKEEAYQIEDPKTSFRLQSEFFYSPTQRAYRRTVQKRMGVPMQREGK